MSGQKKRALVREEGEDDVEDGISAPKKRSVTVKMTIKTVEKWVAENDKALDTSLWLKYVKDGRDMVGLLRCAACVEFEARLVRMRNFRIVCSLMKHLICVLRIF